MRGRAPKPPGLHVLRGNPGKVSRAKLDTPAPSLLPGRPTKPKTLPPAVSAEWDRLADHTAEIGALTVAEGHMLEITARAWAQYLGPAEVVEREGSTYTARTPGGLRHFPRPEAALASKAWERYLTGLRELGLTPSTRGRVALAVPVRSPSPTSRYLRGLDTPDK